MLSAPLRARVAAASHAAGPPPQRRLIAVTFSINRAACSLHVACHRQPSSSRVATRATGQARQHTARPDAGCRRRGVVRRFAEYSNGTGAVDDTTVRLEQIDALLAAVMYPDPPAAARPPPVLISLNQPVDVYKALRQQIKYREAEAAARRREAAAAPPPPGALAVRVEAALVEVECTGRPPDDSITPMGMEALRRMVALQQLLALSDFDNCVSLVK